MSNVFISYAKEDAPAAGTLADALRKAGFSVWWDRHIPPGKTWAEVIGRALDAAACVIVLWSRTSVQSRWVREEAERAAVRSCLIPVLVEKVDPPFGFGQVQAADLSGWRGNEQDPEFVDLLVAVSDLVRTNIEPGKDQPAPPVPGPPKHPRVRPETRTRFLWIAAGVIAVAAATYFASTFFPAANPEAPSKPTTAALPNVIGMPLAEARQLLASRGFGRIIEARRVSPTDTAGTVVDQDPAGGGNVPVDGEVRLVLATRPSPAHPGTPGEQPSGAGLPPLPAPRQVGPPNGTILREPPRSATLVWEPVPGARSYSVEHAFLNAGQPCSSLSRAGRRVPNLIETTYTFRFVESRPGCWRVWAVDERGREGAKSPWWEFGFGPAPPWPSRRYEGFWRNVSPNGRFLQFIEIAAIAPEEVTIRAWLRCNPTPAAGGGIDNCLQWPPVTARVEPNRVLWNYPGEAVGDNVVTLDGPHLRIQTTKTGWRNSFERAAPQPR